MNTQHVDVRENRRRITRLVVAAHAHDEVVGCGGLLAKYRDESAVVLLAELEKESEFIAAQNALGYAGSFQCRLPQGRVGRDMHRLVLMLGDLLSATRPVELYVPYPSVDPDRVAAFEAGMRLARSTVREGQWVPPTVLMYGLPDGSSRGYCEDVDWRICEPLEEFHVGRKIAAALAYTDQAAAADTSNAIRSVAKSAGGRDGTRWGERFAVIRAVRRSDFEVAAESAPALAGALV